MTEQNIRDAFEREPEYAYLCKRTGKDSLYTDCETWQAFMFYKAGYIAAFKVIMESDVDG